MASQGNIMIQQDGKPPTIVKTEDIIKVLKGQQELIEKQKNMLQKKQKRQH